MKYFLHFSSFLLKLTEPFRGEDGAEGGGGLPCNEILKTSLHEKFHFIQMVSNSKYELFW